MLWGSLAIRYAALYAALWCAYAALVFLAWPEGISTAPIVDATMALIVGLMLALRTNRAYERWWEGRILWGQLVNASRNLVSKARVYAAPDAEEARALHALVAGFAFGLRDHLRAGARLGELPGWREAVEDPAHVPGHLATRLNAVLHGWATERRISQDELRMLDLESRQLLEVCGGCERIRTTALPPAVNWATRLAVLVALLGMPWSLEAELGWLIIPVAGIVAFLVIVAESTANAMEHPFGLEFNQLNLSAISSVIDVTTAEMLGVSAIGGTPRPNS